MPPADDQHHRVRYHRWGSSRALFALAVAAALAGCARARTPVIEHDPRPATTAPAPGTVTIASPQRRGPLNANAVVVHVSDGDTISVRFLTDARAGSDPGTGSSTRSEADAARESVRLIGIDTPESKRPDTPIECFANEATAAITSLLPVGTAVTLERDVEERDHYGRLLAYVYRSADGLFVNLEMVRTGMAAPLTIAPNVAHGDRFRAAGSAARALRVGLWSACASGHEPATGPGDTVAVLTRG